MPTPETTEVVIEAEDPIIETWANILLPERYLGILRYPSQAAAKSQASKALLPGWSNFLTEAGPVPVRSDHVVAQVKL